MKNLEKRGAAAFRGAAACVLAALCAAPARAQFILAPNVTYDDNDHDLTDGLCDCDPVLAGDQCTLRAAIENACYYGGSWQILLGPAIFGLSLIGTEDLSRWGDLDIHSLGLGALSRIEISGVAGATVIDASGLAAQGGPERVLHVTSSVGPLTDVVLNGVRLTGGDYGTGGGIRHEGGRLQLSDVDVVGNRAGEGGGIHTTGELSISRGSLQGNQAVASLGSGKGGGLYAQGASVTIHECAIAQNSAGSGGGLSIQAGSTVSLFLSGVSGNSASVGAGIRNHGALVIDACTFELNQATGSGGAIAQDQAPPPGLSTLDAVRTVFRANSAQFGGGVNVNANSIFARFVECTFDQNTAAFIGGGLSINAQTTIERSTISRNSTGGFAGGGIYAFGPLDLVNSTVSSNLAMSGTGAGLYLTGLATHLVSSSTIAFNQGAGLYADAPSWFKSTILSDNHDNSGNPANFDAAPGSVMPTSFGYNLDADGTCGFADPTDQSFVLAYLQPLQNNGGPTETHGLFSCLQVPGGSPAIDRGNPNALNGMVLTEDQRFVARDARCDVGAYELRAQVSSYCDGAVHAFCPCANPGAADSGCDNAQGTGGVKALVSDVDLAVCRATITGTGFPAMGTPTALVLRSNTVSAPTVFGDGLLCTGVPLVRMAATLASGGVSTHMIPHSAMAGSGPKHYQIWYRNQPAAFCDPLSAFNLSSGQTLVWP